MIGENEAVDSIFAYDDFQQVYLPVHFASAQFDLGGHAGRMYQFGSAARTYITGGQQLHVRGDSNKAGTIYASAVGNVVNL